MNFSRAWLNHSDTEILRAELRKAIQDLVDQATGAAIRGDHELAVRRLLQKQQLDNILCLIQQ